MKKNKVNPWIFAVIICMLTGFLAFPHIGRGASAAVFTVNNNGDASDAVNGDGVCQTAGGVCTLRAAIQETNALSGHDTIIVGAYTILPTAPLPTLNDPLGTTITGSSGSAYIDGNNKITVGINIESDNNVIQGLIIWNFTEYGIRVWWGEDNLIGTDADGSNDAAERNILLHNGQAGIFLMGGPNRVSGNYIGVYPIGTMAYGNGHGIYIEGALDENCATVIGTDGNGGKDAAEGNLISGNTYNGIYIHNSCVTVAGNIIGLNAAGTAALPNTRGIVVDEYAPGTLIGTDGDGMYDALERNIISGNTDSGIEVLNDVDQITIAGNYIGLNAAGDAGIPNDVGIYSDSPNSRVGTNSDGVGDAVEGNVISGNTRVGVLLEGYGAIDNVVAGNKVGTNPAGTAPIANGLQGISMIAGAQNNRIGSDVDGESDIEERNLISGNPTGVYIGGANTTGNRIVGNYIGVSVNGDAALPNARGIEIQDAGQNTIGGSLGNLISGNSTVGVSITGISASANTLAGNWIGLDAAGTAALPNPNGVDIYDAAQNTIGTNGDGDNDVIERNIISGNSFAGVRIRGAEASGNIIAGNYIGTSASGSAAVPNYYGISIESPGNLIGTNGDGLADTAERNIISGNLGTGVNIQGTAASGNIIAGNYIGLNAAGNSALKNGAEDWGQGIYLFNAPDTLVGTDADGVADEAERNIISGNNVGGISISGIDSSGSVVAGNYIGTNPAGLVAIPNGVSSWNGDEAIFVDDATVRIGSNGDGVHDSAERNVISGNYGWGIRVMGSTGGTSIAGNYIGVAADGSGALGNGKSGVNLYTGQTIYVGGIAPGLPNIIAYNGQAGVTIGEDPASDSVFEILVRGNVIYNNLALGIDLGNDGVTVNDAQDTDTGANTLQNYPVLSAATGSATSTIIQGSLNSTHSTTFWLDFYASPTCDPTGYGEGQFYLGSHTVTTNASGVVDFSASLSTPVLVGYQIAATATAVEHGGTSEFSQCIPVGITEFVVYLPLITR